MKFNRRAIACALFASAGLSLASPPAMAQAVKVGIVGPFSGPFDEALGYAERALILDHGALVHSGGTASLLADAEALERWVGMAVH